MAPRRRLERGDDDTTSSRDREASVTEVGSTTVVDPDWIDEARESGGY